MGERRRYAIMHEARKLMFGVCCAVGGLAGLWSAIWSAPLDKQQGPLGADLIEMAQPMLTRLGLGLAAGAALALAILVAAQQVRRIFVGTSFSVSP